MSQEASEKLLSKSEAAEFLNISVRSLHDLIRRGALASVRIGGRVLIRPEDLRSFIAARLVVAKD